MIKKCFFSLIFLNATSFALAKNFDQKSLIMPMEVWEGELNNEEFGHIKIMVTFIGNYFYSEDLKKGRLVNALPDANPITGFILINFLDNKKVAKDCHFPRVPIHQFKGFKEKDRIVFWAEEKNAFFSGAYNELSSVLNYQIKNIKNNTGDLLFNSITLQSMEIQNEKIKIVKVK